MKRMYHTQNNAWHELRPRVALITLLIAVLAVMEIAGSLTGTGSLPAIRRDLALEENVVPQAGVELPVRWGGLGKRLSETGVIDDDAWRAFYGNAMSPEWEQLFSGESQRNITITRENAGYLLNLLWAFGLANKNSILEEGEMSDPAYGGAGGFASTGGWTLAKGRAMDHYGMHTLVTLTPEQQALVEKVSQNIYRPCCDNSTHFPDCNHGMAMLGLLELMASQGAREEEMYKAALAANSYWFPDAYQTIATYMHQRGVAWNDVDPREMLGRDYSSASGYARVASEVQSQGRQGNSCGV